MKAEHPNRDQLETVGAAQDPEFSPRWLQEISSSLFIRSQFLISGNVWDDYVLSLNERIEVTQRNEALWQTLKSKGVSALIIFDAAQGFQLHDGCKSIPANLRRRLSLSAKNTALTLEKVINTIQKISKETGNGLALVVEYTSQLLESLGEKPQKQNEFLIAMDKISRRNASVRYGEDGTLPWTPVFWIVGQPGDLPDWFTIDNPSVRAIKIDLPTQEERFLFAQHLATDFAKDDETPDPYSLLAPAPVEAFALQSEGMTLQAMRQVAVLMATDNQNIDAITDAIRAYRVGSRRNPWRTDLMRSRILKGEEILTRRVKGQLPAVRRTLDVLIRSMMGLSGAQISSRHNRPRGVLFFAGPTGVGKTELAKSVTELLFGDETAHFRFDMS